MFEKKSPTFCCIYGHLQAAQVDTWCRCRCYGNQVGSGRSRRQRSGSAWRNRDRNSRWRWRRRSVIRSASLQRQHNSYRSLYILTAYDLTLTDLNKSTQLVPNSTTRTWTGPGRTRQDSRGLVGDPGLRLSLVGPVGIWTLHDAFIGHSRQRHDYTSHWLATAKLGCFKCFRNSIKRLISLVFSFVIFYLCDRICTQ